MRPLGEQLPRLMERFSPIHLAELPTPVVHLAGLGRRTGHAHLYLKRDSHSSPVYGGNKVRKLEFLLSEARRRGVSTVVTMGGVGSNHLLATALHAKALGIRTVGVVFPQPDEKNVRRNQLADRGAGVELVPVPSKYLLPAYLARTLVSIRRRERRKPFLIPGGGSSPLGVLGFVNAGLELAAQVKSGLLPEPGEVFVPYGTGGTAAGLSLGLQLAGMKTKVVAVRVIDRLLANRPRLMMLLSSTARFLASQGDQVARPVSIGKNLQIRQGYIGPGYGHPTREAEQALELFEQEEGARLELTYTGKAAAAFLDEARASTAPLLFWNTYSSADISGWVEKGKTWH